MKIRPILAACAAPLILSTAARATPITLTIDNLNTLQVTGSSATVNLVSPGDWTVSLSGVYLYSSLSLEFASPDYGGPGANVYLTTPRGGGPMTVLVSKTAPAGFYFNNCGSNASAAVSDGTTCGIGYTSSFAPVSGTVREVASPAATPEPSSLLLLGTGMLGLGVALRRRLIRPEGIASIASAPPPEPS